MIPTESLQQHKTKIVFVSSHPLLFFCASYELYHDSHDENPEFGKK